AKANEESDKQAREKVDKLNAADSMIFQTEKQLKEFGDKLPADKKGPIEQAFAKLKDAHQKQDIEAIDAATNELNTAWQAASEELYKAQQSQQQGQQQPTEEPTSTEKKDEEVTDVDFEEVK
ncbi:MAG TPA: Hsp70 family protein, partial [Tenuifilaceae bacterium]|nr:Hsp70 family protein [Tenuifilaceae bacterium]